MENPTRRVELSNRRQPAFLFYLWMLLYMVLAILLRAAAFAPLYVLFAPSVNSSLRFLALLTPIMLIFIVLPLRFSMADALVQEHGERSFRLGKAFSFSQYGDKLKESFFHMLSVLKWGIPLILGIGYLAYQLGYIRIGKSVDAFTMLTGLETLGIWAGNAWAGISNFFTGGKLVIEGGYVEGAILIALILALFYMLLMFGAMRNSARRYIWAQSSREDRDARVETRRRLAGRRWRQFLVAMINLAILLPPIILVAFSLKDTLKEVSAQLANILARTAKLTSLAGSVRSLLIAFFALYLPFLPIRRMLTCSFATRTTRQRTATKPLDEATQTAIAAKGEAR